MRKEGVGFRGTPSCLVWFNKGLLRQGDTKAHVRGLSPSLQLNAGARVL